VISYFSLLLLDSVFYILEGGKKIFRLTLVTQMIDYIHTTQQSDIIIMEEPFVTKALSTRKRKRSSDGEEGEAGGREIMIMAPCHRPQQHLSSSHPTFTNIIARNTERFSESSVVNYQTHEKLIPILINMLFSDGSIVKEHIFQDWIGRLPDYGHQKASSVFEMCFLRMVCKLLTCKPRLEISGRNIYLFDESEFTWILSGISDDSNSPEGYPRSAKGHMFEGLPSLVISKQMDQNIRRELMDLVQIHAKHNRTLHSESKEYTQTNNEICVTGDKNPKMIIFDDIIKSLACGFGAETNGIDSNARMIRVLSKYKYTKLFETELNKKRKALVIDFLKALCNYKKKVPSSTPLLLHPFNTYCGGNGNGTASIGISYSESTEPSRFVSALAKKTQKSHHALEYSKTSPDSMTPDGVVIAAAAAKNSMSITSISSSSSSSSSSNTSNIEEEEEVPKENLFIRERLARFFTTIIEDTRIKKSELVLDVCREFLGKDMINSPSQDLAYYTISQACAYLDASD
jgi:hypothetical protein